MSGAPVIAGRQEPGDDDTDSDLEALVVEMLGTELLCGYSPILFQRC